MDDGIDDYIFGRMNAEKENNLTSKATPNEIDYFNCFNIT